MSLGYSVDSEVAEGNGGPSSNVSGKQEDSSVEEVGHNGLSLAELESTL